VRIRPLLILALALLVTTALPVAAAPPASPAAAAPAKRGAQVTLDFKDVELTDLIQTISEMTGKNFVYDDTVKGKATIVSPRGMSLEEAYQVFLSVLNVKGFTVVPAGRMNKIIRIQDAKESGLPTGTEAESSGAEQFVTRLVPLRYIEAATFATTVLAPLVPKTGSVVPFAPTNTLIITDSSANIERLLKIIRELDVAGTGAELEVIFLQYASADEVAQIGSQVLAQTAASPRKGRAAGAGIPAGQAAAGPSGKVIPFSRANAIVVMADGSDMETIRALVASLDRKPEGARSNINVYYLENADAESLAKTLNDIITGTRQKQPRPAGQPAGTSEAVTITFDKATNSLVINATPEDYETIRGIVRQLDIKRKQVFVEALILELSMDATQKLGASLAGVVPIGDDSVAFGAMNQVAPGVGVLSPGETGIPSILTQSVDGILAGGLFNMVKITAPDGTIMRVPALSALINLSKTDTDVNILSAPRLLTTDNEEAQIVIGDNVPVITSRLTSGASSELNQSVTVERKDAALTLKVTPQITEGNLVRLKLYQESTGVKDTSANAAYGSVNQVGPTFTKRLIQNTVVAEDGKTVVLGGLIGNSVQEVVTKVPFLGDIPFLGWLFKRKETVEKKTNLLVFITPRIIRSAADLAHVTQQSSAAMNQFQKEEMGGALEKNSYASQALEQVSPPAEPSLSPVEAPPLQPEEAEGAAAAPAPPLPDETMIPGVPAEAAAPAPSSESAPSAAEAVPVAPVAPAPPVEETAPSVDETSPHE